MREKFQEIIRRFLNLWLDGVQSARSITQNAGQGFVLPVSRLIAQAGQDALLIAGRGTDFLKKLAGSVSAAVDSFAYALGSRIERAMFLFERLGRLIADRFWQIGQIAPAFPSFAQRAKNLPKECFVFLKTRARFTLPPRLAFPRATFSFKDLLLARWRRVLQWRAPFSLRKIASVKALPFQQKSIGPSPVIPSAVVPSPRGVEGAALSSSGASPVIRLERVSVIYDVGKSNETRALSDVSLEIYPGEYVTFFGPSGCGKSTLLYAIAGLEKTTEGRIQVEGKELTRMTPRELIWFHRATLGMVFQAYYLIPNLSARDNIILPQVFAGVPPQNRARRVQDLMEKFGIADFAHRKPSMLSGGQQQRTSIARALVNNPSIVLADEPVGNLDSKNADIVLKLLEEINQKDGKTVIHVTHNPRDLHYANRVFFMRDGKVERVVRNAGKPGPSRLTPDRISELEQLAQAYPYLTESRLRSKLILHHLLLPYGIDTQQKIEETIENFILNKISQSRLFDMLNTPQEKGGAGLYVQRARELSEKIARLVEEIKVIAEEAYPTLTPLEERAQNLRGYLLDGYKGKLSFEQIRRLEDGLLQRLLGKISAEEFGRFLDVPTHQRGVGLNSRTARRFAREIELILMKE